jgi:steroid 5-alpha reductase family enzyme
VTAPTTAASLAVVCASTGLGLGVAVLAGGEGVATLGMPVVFWCALVAFAIQWFAFVPAYVARTERFYDLTGSLSYLTVTIGALAATALHRSLDLRSALVAGLVVVWAARLGSFLFRRVHRAGKDGRFDEIKHSWHRFLVAWTLQGLWITLTALAALVQISDATPRRSFDLFDASGLALWALGFAVEVIADRQKAAFSSRPESRGRFIDEGLWSWSRHPNYVGEILLWCGVFVMGAGGFRSWQWLAVLSPVFVWALLRFVSGVPLLEERADAKWGGQADYEAYKIRTPVLWPRLGRG